MFNFIVQTGVAACLNSGEAELGGAGSFPHHLHVSRLFPVGREQPMKEESEPGV